MIYDQYGRKIDIEAITAPLSGRNAFPEMSDRLESDVSRELTPTKIDQILRTANTGETSDQCRLAMEIEEKNWDVAHSLETRRNAVRGVDWSIEPGGESAADKKAAEDFKAVLEGTGIGGTDTFENLLDDMMNALLPGFSVSEIVWLPGGKGIAGFSFIDQRHFTFRDGFSPRLVTRDDSRGVELPPDKAVIHRYRKRGGDPARGGLIRPLAWLHCFLSVDFKDLLRLMERYGMPFTVARVDQNAWDNERAALRSLIRNFGPDGGGVFTKAVELEILKAPNADGEIYFKLLTYLGDAITKVILGQTASSSDGGGLSGDNAQSEVRQDILESDCDLIAGTVNAQLIKPWANWNLSQSANPPKMIFHTDPPEDVKAIAETVKTLYEAGLEADESEMSEKFGMRLTRKAPEGESSVGRSVPARPSPSSASGTASDSGVKSTPKNSTNLALSEEGGRGDVSESNREGGRSLPAVAPEGAKEGRSALPTDALAANSLAIFAKTGALKWAAPVLNADPDAESPLEFGLKMEKLFTEDAMFDTRVLAEAIENNVYAAAASGKAEKADDLISKGGVE